ncbi:olfactory receptor 6B1-like [Malaclemys terrapin pileata]|uniref:olfactory receptor 6B1-like n=1 Tax=Malaclemys terrapin pileata TaxID=2991368 RepID=UPI0023A7C4FD|nr:olfactory receptor 6B1-like [Malaclemys terrapin pileata]
MTDGETEELNSETVKGPTEQENNTSVQEFILLGFPTILELQIMLFVIFLVAYVLTLLENMVIIALIQTNHHLHKPMYFFLSHLSFLEAWYISVTIPKLLVNFLVDNKSISFVGCMTQLYFFSSLLCTECVLLASMAYDRYVAICNPLRYPAIMTHRFCLQLAAVSWVSGFSISMVKVSFISQLTFCSPGIINHFFCDISPVLNLACTDMSLAETVDFVLALIILMVPLSVTIVSYLCIIATILHLPTVQGRKKAFSTCASHLTVVIIFFSTSLFMYARPKKIHPFDLNKVVSVVYTIVTPMLNPFIYCLRNQEVKGALRKAFCGVSAVHQASVTDTALQRVRKFHAGGP